MKVATTTSQKQTASTTTTAEDKNSRSDRENLAESKEVLEAVQEEIDTKNLISDSIKGKSLFELRNMEQEYKMILSLSDDKGQTAQGIRAYLEAIEEAKVEVKRRR